MARHRVQGRGQGGAGGPLAALVVLAVAAVVGVPAAGNAVQKRTAEDAAPDRTAAVLVPATASPAPPASTPATPPMTSTATAPPSLLSGARVTGHFAVASGQSRAIGRGHRVTYAVAVETGIALRPADFATQVDRLVGDPGGWASGGTWSLQRRGDAGVDLVIRLATPATVDHVCGQGGLHTDGYASCRVGSVVMINLARWESATPQFAGRLDVYRHYVVNHELGHGLGLGHLGCGGLGRPAPVMQQQTYGLRGCLPNGSPYVAGRLVTGPPAS